MYLRATQGLLCRPSTPLQTLPLPFWGVQIPLTKWLQPWLEAQVPSVLPDPVRQF